MKELILHTDSVLETLTDFISDCLRKTGLSTGVLGLSGGLDSTVAVYLTARALGKDGVYGVIMPYKESDPLSEVDAKKVCELLGIRYEIVDITRVIDEYFKDNPDADKNRRGNKMARERMSILYDVSARENGLVIGTSNKSEFLLGYGTIYGDLGYAINPMGDLYKTQVYQIAEALGVPKYIREKTPSADLWQGQTDEEDLGYSYADIDKLLYYMVDRRFNDERLKDLGFSGKMINDIRTRIRRNHFKRIPPLIAKISSRTIGHEFRYVWDWSSV